MLIWAYTPSDYPASGGCCSATITLTNTATTTEINSLTFTVTVTETESPSTTSAPPETSSTTSEPPATSTPCNNAGLEVAMYDSPFPFDNSTNSYPAFDFSYYQTAQPWNTSLANYVGATEAQEEASNFTDYGMVSQQGVVYTLNFRGFFYCPVTDTYTVSLYNVDDLAAIWLGQNAYLGYTESDASLVSRYHGGTGYQNVQTSFQCNGGTYAPIRIIMGNKSGARSYDVSITGSSGTSYVTSQQVSQYLVHFPDCNPAQTFPCFFGYEVAGAVCSKTTTTTTTTATDSFTTTTTTTDSFTTTATAITTVTPVAISDLGCFTDQESPRVLNAASRQDGSQTVDKCIQWCFSQGYKYAGVEYGEYVIPPKFK
ncbi:hypothetical protein AA313_de0205312 [Arthrobotrys entomopaga]|nr:hypothetical protein AA313_de0205312 [Arthrobotrys entomopaga]